MTPAVGQSGRVVPKTLKTGRAAYLLDAFGDVVEARGRAGTLNGSGRKRQKQDGKHARMEKEAPRKKNWNIRIDIGGVHEGIKDNGLGLGMI